MGYLYIATPYGHKDPLVMDHRTRHAAQLHTYLHQHGVMAYVPIAYTTIELDVDVPEDHWYDFGLVMLEKAQGLVVCRLSGWGNSKGIGLEIDRAYSLSIPVAFSEPRYDDVLATCQRMAIA